MKAIDIVNINSKQLVYISRSKINDNDNHNNGLFAKKHITKGCPVVIYFGDKITDDEIYDLYTNDPDSYYELNKYIRGTPNGFAIKGDKTQINHNLLGVYVNDFASIRCNKDEINEKVLRDYAHTISRCNLKTVDTVDYPIYVSTKRIKKHEEMYAHYGIGYWLSYIGCSPIEISDLNKKYNFNSLYE